MQWLNQRRRQLSHQEVFKHQKHLKRCTSSQLMHFKGAGFAACNPHIQPIHTQKMVELRDEWHSNRCTFRNTRRCKVRSKIRWFTEICNSHYLSHFAAFFIDAWAKRSVVNSCVKIKGLPTSNGLSRHTNGFVKKRRANHAQLKVLEEELRSSLLQSNVSTKARYWATDNQPRRRLAYKSAQVERDQEPGVHLNQKEPATTR